MTTFIRPFHVLIAMEHVMCPRCSAMPQDDQKGVVRGLQGSSGQVYVCEACWAEWLQACPSHVLPRSNSRAVA